MGYLLAHAGEPGEEMIKSQATAGAYAAASVRLLEGSGQAGSKPRPFNYEAAVQRFRSWVYAAAMLNAQAVAAVPLRLYVRRRRGRAGKLFRGRPVTRGRLRYLAGEHPGQRPGPAVLRKVAQFRNDFEEVTDAHPALSVLLRANPLLNGFQLTALRVLYQELTGNAYLHPVIDPRLGVPCELWPMPSQWVSIVPDRERLIRGYHYGRPGAQPIVFAPEEVIHFKYPGPDNLFYGKGKVEAGWSVITRQEARSAMDVAFYDNMARPDYAVIVRSGASGEELERFEARINALLRGAKQAGKFLTVTGDVELKPLNFPPKDLGDPEEVVEEIAAVFGVPVSKLKTNDPNRASADAAERAWLRGTIHSLCVQDDQKLNEAYLPLFGIEDDAFLAYDNPAPEDRQFELERQTRLLAAGALTVNEVRAEEGLEPLPTAAGGDANVNVNADPNFNASTTIPERSES